jgi:hypothetical protein
MDVRVEGAGTILRWVEAFDNRTVRDSALRCASRARMLEIAPPASPLVAWCLPFLGADHRIIEDSGASPL